MTQTHSSAKAKQSYATITITAPLRYSTTSLYYTRGETRRSCCWNRACVCVCVWFIDYQVHSLLPCYRSYVQHRMIGVGGSSRKNRTHPGEQHRVIHSCHDTTTAGGNRMVILLPFHVLFLLLLMYPPISFLLGFVWTMTMTMTMAEVSCCCVPFANFSIVYKLPLLLYYYGTTRQRWR